jgi:Peptidase family M23
MPCSSYCNRSRWLSGSMLRATALIGLLVGSGTGRAGATDYIWPLSKSSMPDAMNTSFGPRVNNSKWDFHDGIDLPGDCGRNVYAVAAGTIEAAGESDSNWSSRHVVIKVNDTSKGYVYVYYLHLDAISQAVTVALANHTTLPQGELIGQLGMNGASYCHLHLEFRQGNGTGTPPQSGSQHPLSYLPYTDTANFIAPAGARFNRQINGGMAARLVFGAGSKLEGDLAKVEVELKKGSLSLATRQVIFNDKSTINEGNSDDLEFVNDIAVEGYQTSNMILDGRSDLKYGVVVRNLPGDCDTLVAKVYDLGNHVVTSAPIGVPNQVAVEQSLDFENALAPPPGWQARTSKGTSIGIYPTFAHGGTHSLIAIDDSVLAVSQQAAIEYSLGSDRFEWLAEAWICVRTLDLSTVGQVYLLHFLDASGANLSVSGRLSRAGSSTLAGIVAKKPNGSNTSRDSSVEEIETSESFRKWALRLLRVGTRETTAVLFLDDVELARHSWDSSGTYEPLKVRIGVGQSFSQVKAILHVDDALITEKTM